MFKRKRQEETIEQIKKAVEPVEEEIEDEETIEQFHEATKEEKQIIKPQENKLKIGDVIPITKVIGFQIIKSFDEKGEALVITTESQFEAEVLSRLYLEDELNKRYLED